MLFFDEKSDFFWYYISVVIVNVYVVRSDLYGEK